MMFCSFNLKTTLRESCTEAAMRRIGSSCIKPRFIGVFCYLATESLGYLALFLCLGGGLVHIRTKINRADYSTSRGTWL
ncbi:UNVERIFIED_ORG: hypothetical protein M2414_002870 [Rahnella aquatilis]|nr:hypothetical protein [Rahnella aquatilis]